MYNWYKVILDHVPVSHRAEFNEIIQQTNTNKSNLNF